VELAEFEAAIDSLQRAIAMQPSLINAHFQLAKAYRQVERTKDAVRESTLFAAMTDRVDTSHGLNGADEEQAWKQVKPLLEANKEQEALELLAKLPVAEASDAGRRLYLLGIMYFSMGRSQDAKRVLAIAQTKSPKSAAIAAYLGMVRLSGGEVAGAEESFKSALAIDSSEPLALIGMGGIRYQQENWKESIEYLEKSRTADPDALLMLCEAYYRAGKPEQAALTAEAIRALGAGREPLLDQLERLVTQHQKDQPHTP
jgi:tetratricopeptide (TPR) repeat protein